ncbi:hypothetical protein ACIRBX_11950 [Kitasatospora sp. NPDC096147]|uniref:hypothetical protein n=1 Tax=Kitasatospora sp. NPDC096147 TaxID=3364093 RepID=UPI00382F6AB5
MAVFIHFTERAQVHRAPVTAGAYTRRRDWEMAQQVWEGWVSAQPSSTTEARSPDRDLLSETLHVYLPTDAVVGRHDRIDVDGITYEIEGEPEHHRGPRPHIRITAWRAR